MRKHIPTDMDWHPTFHGNYVCVYMYADENTGIVSIHGGDDTALAICFSGPNSAANAEALYNSLTYIQGHEDLKIFYQDVFPEEWCAHNNSNGSPAARMIFPTAFTYPEPIDDLDEWIAQSSAVRSF